MTSTRQWATELADEYDHNVIGWIQGSFTDIDGDQDCYCLYGGIYYTSGVRFGRTPSVWEPDVWRLTHHQFQNDKDKIHLAEVRHNQLSGWIYNKINKYGAIEWNDTEGRTKDQVVALLREYADEQEEVESRGEDVSFLSQGAAQEG